MNYDPPIAIVERLAPDAQTRAGIAWRLYWLWPELRCLYLAALLAWAFAAFVAPRYFQVPHDPAAGVFAPIELLVFIPLLFLSLLSSEPASGRALAMLPVQRKRLRDAVWFIDVPSAPLMCIAACLLMALIVPMPAPYRPWFIIAALLAATIHSGARATMSMSVLADYRARSNGLLAMRAYQIDPFAPALFFICLVAMFLWRDLPQVTWATVAVCVAISAWSFVRRPMMAGTRGDGGARRKQGSAAFSSGWWEIAWLYIRPALKNLRIICLFFAMYAYFLGKHFWNREFVIYLLIPLIFWSVRTGEAVATRIRAARLLPMSSRELTIAIHLHGFIAALPLVLIFAFVMPTNPANLSLLLAVAIFTTALSAGSLWQTFYPFHFVPLISGVLFIFSFSFPVLIFSKDPLPIGHFAILSLLLGVAFFVAVAWSIDRKFWWDSKVYRHQYQQSHGQKDMGNLSASGEALYLAFAFVLILAGILCGFAWFADGAS